MKMENVRRLHFHGQTNVINYIRSLMSFDQVEFLHYDVFRMSSMPMYLK